MSTRNHEYKCWPFYFQQVWKGDKRFEVRGSREGEHIDGRTGRDPRVGDSVILREFDQSAGEYTGRGVQVTVIYVMEGGRFGLADDAVAFGFDLDVKVGGDTEDEDE